MTQDKRELLLTPASQISSRRQKWLWNDRIPLGTVTIFAGRGGEGKSTYALHVGAQAITGSLDGDLKGIGSSLVMISHEDDWATVMKPRLIAARADPKDVFKLAVKSTVDDTTAETVPALPLDIELIREAVLETGARLIIIDPISSTLGGDLHKLADVRRGLDPLAALAQELELAVIAIMHFNKGTGNVSDKLSGSHAFRDLSRSVLLFATDDETGRRIVSVDKSNYSAERGSSFAFNLRTVMVETDDGDSTSVAQVEDLGDTDLSVNDIVNRSTGDADDDDRSDSERWLISYLETGGGAALAKDIRKASNSDGLSWDSVKRVSTRITDKNKSGFQGAWQWTLNLTKGSTKGAKSAGVREPAPFAPYVQNVTPLRPRSADEGA